MCRGGIVTSGTIVGNDRRGTCVEYRNDPHACLPTKRKHSEGRDVGLASSNWQMSRGRDGVVNFRVQFRRRGLPGRTSGCGLHSRTHERERERELLSYHCSRAFPTRDTHKFFPDSVEITAFK